MKRGLESTLALQVADQLMAKDAIGTHARDGLGISAALTSAPAAFSVGAAMPLAMVLFSPVAGLAAAVSVASLLFLAVLGAIGAKAGGASERLYLLPNGSFAPHAGRLVQLCGFLKADIRACTAVC